MNTPSYYLVVYGGSEGTGTYIRPKGAWMSGRGVLDHVDGERGEKLGLRRHEKDEDFVDDWSDLYWAERKDGAVGLGNNPAAAADEIGGEMYVIRSGVRKRYRNMGWRSQARNW